MVIEVKLRIPNLTIKTAGQPAHVVNNTGVRFLKTMTVRAVPKVGALIDVTVRPSIRDRPRVATPTAPPAQDDRFAAERMFGDQCTQRVTKPTALWDA